ncbi:MAG: hypothetical protein P8H59_02955 [Flavobacteriales bacterium]|nr:hypothetical protein [Flavobacteriales bacterium]MDG2245870.1 hypothetical protein [Flavobacteriales bacterium]
MRLNKIIILLSIALAPIVAQSQSSRIEVTLLDASNDRPVIGAYLGIAPALTSGEITDINGIANFTTRDFKICLQISHIQYKDTLVCIESIAPGENRSVSIKLSQNQTWLPTASITGEVDTVFGHDLFHVADYIVSRDKLYLLVYENEKMFKKAGEQNRDLYDGCRVLLMDNRSISKESKSVVVRETSSRFYDQYPGQCILETREGYAYVLEAEEELFLRDLSREEFKKNIAPVIDTLGNEVFASTYFKDYPAFDYIHFAMTDTVAQTLVSIEDNYLMEQFRSEYKWLSGRGKLEAYRTELRTGIDKEVVGGFMSGFSSSMYYEPLYAPLFASKNQVYIFDHYGDMIYRVNDQAEIQDSIPITYHTEKESRFWKNQIVFDQVLEMGYAVYERLGKTYLKEINLSTGETGEPIELSFRYPENINVYNGEVYYLYRPFESPQKKFLYREVIASPR